MPREAWLASFSKRGSAGLAGHLSFFLPSIRFARIPTKSHNMEDTNVFKKGSLFHNHTGVNGLD